MTEQANVSIPLYLPNGLRVNVNIPVTDPLEIFRLASGVVAKWQLDGGLINPPAAAEGEEVETIVTVMRRQKDDGTPIIDFYPEWGAGTDKPYGTYKFLHMYLDDDKVADFLAVSGFKSLEDIPLYAGQSSLTRTAGKVNPNEKRVPTPFKLVKKEGKEETGKDGRAFRPWKFVRYEPLAISNSAQPPPPNQPLPWNGETVKKLTDDVFREHGLSKQDVMDMLGVKAAWSEWKGTFDDAWARVVLEATKQEVF